MIVTCSVCKTRYLVDPRALGAGRMVRCAQCSHTWHQVATGTPPLDVVSPPPPPPAPAQPVAPTAPESGPGPAPAAAAPAPPRPNESEDRIQLPAVPASRRPVGAVIGWLALVVIVAGVLGGAYMQRDDVIRLWPASARLYSLVGLGPSQASEVLQVRAVPRRDEENGVPRLVIEGEVINTSAQAQPVPKLKVMLKDSSDRVVQSWTFAVSTDRLLPGASVPFTTSVTRPSEAATGMVVDFVNGDQ